MVNAELEEWLLSRPESVRRLAAEFQMLSTVEVRGTRYFIIGYTEDDMLILSTVHPGENYQEAMASRKHIHAEHLRGPNG